MPEIVDLVGIGGRIRPLVGALLDIEIRTAGLVRVVLVVGNAAVLAKAQRVGNQMLMGGIINRILLDIVRADINTIDIAITVSERLGAQVGNVVIHSNVGKRIAIAFIPKHLLPFLGHLRR
jgi:hypothetical protein